MSLSSLIVVGNSFRGSIQNFNWCFV
jgi:hypothetical protein